MPPTNVPLVAKDPKGPLRVLVVGRISTIHQNIENIDASYRFVEGCLKKMYEGPISYKHLGEQGSGMRTDRATIVEAEDEIATGSWDLVITEDLSRFYRNPRHQYAFVQDAVDHETRVICIGDNLDTAEEGWEVALGAATLRHGLHIPDTRRRVKRTAQHAFHNGAMVQKVRFGYRKLSAQEAGAGGHGSRGLRIARESACTPIIREMARRVLEGAAYSAVARWLNDQEIAPGPYVTTGVWTGKLVQDLLRDPILHGTRTFGDVLSRTIYSTGRHKRRKNPEGPETEHHPELAHLSEEEHRALIRIMDERAGANRHASGPGHTLYNRPRARSIWPGQHARCAACGALMYRYDDDQLKCKGAFRAKGEGSCWNHVQVSCQEVRDRVLPRLLDHCDQFPGFRRALADAAWSELQARERCRSRVHRAADEEVAALEKRVGNLTRAIELGGDLDALVRQLAGVEEALKAARRRRAEQISSAASGPALGSRDEVERQLGMALRVLARTSFEFADLMRRVIPEFVIVPVQALDSGLVRPRARLTLRLSALTVGADAVVSPAPSPGDLPMVIDLFEPPLHIKAVSACDGAKRADPGLSLEKIAARTGYGRMTVKRALAYARLMATEGTGEPYRELKQRPSMASRWKHCGAS
jgi:DNA invertase Pin-like site-specific DNA recombinase